MAEGSSNSPILSGVVIAGLGGIATAIGLTAIANLTGWLEGVFQPALPAGAIIAVDSEKGCPDPWVDMGSTWGKKTLVVAIDEADPNFGYRKTGGSETHILRPEQIPGHQHSILTWEPIRNTARRFDTRDGDGLHPPNPAPPTRDKQTRLQTVEEDRAATAHNNMPPYVALYFCKKEG